MEDTRLTSPLHDPLHILITANPASQLLQCPLLKVALPGAPASDHLMVLKMKPPSSPGCGYPHPVPNQLQLSSCTKYWSYTLRNLPRISFVKQEYFNINLKPDKLNFSSLYKIKISHIHIFSLYSSWQSIPAIKALDSSPAWWSYPPPEAAPGLQHSSWAENRSQNFIHCP